MLTYTHSPVRPEGEAKWEREREVVMLFVLDKQFSEAFWGQFKYDSFSRLFPSNGFIYTWRWRGQRRQLAVDMFRGVWWWFVFCLCARGTISASWHALCIIYIYIPIQMIHIYTTYAILSRSVQWSIRIAAHIYQMWHWHSFEHSGMYDRPGTCLCVVANACTREFAAVAQPSNLLMIHFYSALSSTK